jgi:hypothetical protein
MTFNEIIKQALTHLEYGTDEDSMAVFFTRFMQYANDAVRLIAKHLRLDKVESVTLDNYHFELSDLSKPLVTKISEVYVGHRQYPCVKGDELGDFVVVGEPWRLQPDATVSVRYRWMPVDETDGGKEPDIPEVFHGIIWMYVVHMHNNSRSSGVTGYNYQNMLAEFERQRKILTRDYGALDGYTWKNRPWETKEM